MNYSVSLLTEASDDLDSIGRWYEEKSTGLGNRFGIAIEQQARLLQTIPSKYRIFHRDVRRSSVPGFPYDIYFKIVEHQIIIVAVYGARQDPKLLRKRIDVSA